jgi:hypothetical protein
MIRCYQCGTDNLDGSEYCDECGKKLDTAGSPVQPKRMPSPPQLPSQAIPPPPSFTRETITPKPATPYTPPPPPVHPPVSPGPKTSFQSPPASPMTSVPAHQNQTSAFSGPTSGLRGSRVNLDRNQQQAAESGKGESQVPQVRARLVILRGGKVGKEFSLAGDESLIGRWDADGGIFPDVDLDQDDPEAKISRRHARIHFLNNQFLIEDLGSTNGTFINRGPRLLPGNRQPLNNGDEIIVGKTFLKFVLS